MNNRLEQPMQTTRLAVLAEIVVVLAPLYVGVVMVDVTGVDHVTLGGNVTLLGGPLAYLGLALTLVLLWITSRLRGATWVDLGAGRPASWPRVVLASLGVALAVFVAVKLVLGPAADALVGAGLAPRDMSRFDLLASGLPTLLVNLAVMWISAAFLEELLWRGYLMNRLMDLLGGQTRGAGAIAAVGSAVVFGLAHAAQGPVGVLWTGGIGLVLGLSFLLVGRSIWPLVLAHGLIDTLDFVGHYFGS